MASSGPGKSLLLDTTRRFAHFRNAKVSVWRRGYWNLWGQRLPQPLGLARPSAGDVLAVSVLEPEVTLYALYVQRMVGC